MISASLGSRDDHPGAAVDVGPGERRNLAFSPRGDEREGGEVFEVFRQVRHHGFEFGPFKESGTGVPLGQSLGWAQWRFNPTRRVGTIPVLAFGRDVPEVCCAFSRSIYPVSLKKIAAS
jgi:hypothetical protein